MKENEDRLSLKSVNFSKKKGTSYDILALGREHSVVPFYLDIQLSLLGSDGLSSAQRESDRRAVIVVTDQLSGGRMPACNFADVVNDKRAVVLTCFEVIDNYSGIPFPIRLESEGVDISGFFTGFV